MTYRLFEIPEYHEFVDALGVGPEHLDDGVLRLDFSSSDEDLVVTLDQPGRSVHVRWLRGSVTVLEFFHEGAVLAGFHSSNEASALVIDFEVDDLRGVLKLQTEPSFTITDKLLFH